MGSEYRSPKLIGPGKSIFLATPSKERIKAGYAYSLTMTVAELCHKGIPFQLAIMEDNCHVDDGRNALVKTFLYETNCTDLVFLDADVRWMPDMFTRLISHDTEDIIAGAYPLKSYPIKFPVGKLLYNEGEEMTEKGLLSVSYAPTGFMRIPRSVFEKLRPAQTSRGRGKSPTHRFFERRYTVNTYDGGDVAFCRKWIAEGGKVLIDSKLRLEHIGEWRWAGCFLDYLSKDKNKLLHTKDSKDPVPEYKPDDKPTGTVDDAIQALKDDMASIDDFTILADAWGNKPWAATAQFAETAYKMAMRLKNGATILECGSGFTSIVLAVVASLKGLQHVVLENNPVWHTKVTGTIKELGLNNTDVVHSRYNERKHWYNFECTGKADFIVIDGPARDIGAERMYPIKHDVGLNALYLIDDCKSVEVPGEWMPVVLGGRHAVFGRADNQELINKVKRQEKSAAEPVKAPEPTQTTGNAPISPKPQEGVNND